MATLKNLACWRLAEMLNNPGLARYSDYRLPFTDEHQVANELLLERTSKGGLHGLPSQVNNGTQNRGAYALPPAAIYAHILANPTHEFFLGIIGNKTRDRAGTTNFPRTSTLRRTASASDTRNVVQFSSSNASAAGSNTGGKFSHVDLAGAPRASGATGVYIAATSSSAWASTVPATLAEITFHAIVFGNSRDNAPATNQCHGHILYGLYMEDLTFSGRTYATVQAQLLAQAQTDFGAGGRYAGDTYTDPATFA